MSPLNLDFNQSNNITGSDGDESVSTTCPLCQFLNNLTNYNKYAPIPFSNLLLGIWILPDVIDL